MHLSLIMSSKKEKSSKKKVVEENERVPKHVMIRLSYRDYLKLNEYAKAAGEMKENKEAKKAMSIISDFGEDLTAEKFLGLIAGLPAKERTLARFYSQPPRAAPTKMYFTDPQKCTKEVTELHEACKKWTKGKLRYDQKKETCPTDVRVMFYTYIREKGLIETGKPDITIDKFLKKIAPKALHGIKHVKRGNSSFVWEVCSEIRGVAVKKKSSKDESPKKSKKVESSDEESSDEEPVKKSKKKVVESSEEESDYEPIKKSKKKIVESSDDESEEESSDEEPVKKNKRR